MWMIIALLVQFALIGVLAVVVLSLARQIGILHERTAPAALVRNAPATLEAGAQLEDLTLNNLAGEGFSLTQSQPRRGSALLFIAPDCPICRSVLPAFAIALEERRMDFRGYWVGDGLDPEGYARYAASSGIDLHHAVVSQELGLKLGVRELPVLVLLDEELRLISRQTLNGPKQLVSAFAQVPCANPNGEKIR